MLVFHAGFVKTKLHSHKLSNGKITMALHQIQGLHNNIVIKIVLFFIALTFIWSLGDFSNFTNAQYVAKVGRKIVTQEEYNRAHDNVMTQYGSSFQGMTAEQLKAIGVHSMILNGLVRDKLKEILLEDLNIKISDQRFVEMVKAHKAFHTDNVFDVEKFKHYLKHNHFSETEFADMLKIQTSNSMFFDTIADSYIPNTALSELLYQYQFEKRFFDLYIISPNLSTNLRPSDKELEDFYNQNSSLYHKPESRSIKLAIHDPSILRSELVVTDQEISRFYQENTQMFTTPELRDLEVFIFENQDAAYAAKRSGNFNAASERKSYKSVAKSALPSESAAIIFNASHNMITDVFAQDGKYWVVKTTKITEEKHQTLKQVNNVIKDDILRSKLATLVSERLGKLEDSIQMSMSTADIAKEYNLNFKTLEIIRDTMHVPSEVFNEIMRSESKDVELFHHDQKIYIYQIEKVTPEYPLAFNVVKSRVVQDYIKQARESGMEKFAALLSSGLKSGNINFDMHSNHEMFLVKKLSNLSLTRLNLANKNFIAGVPDAFVKKLEQSNDMIIDDKLEGTIYVAKINKNELPFKIDQDKLSFVQNQELRDAEKVFEQSLIAYLYDQYKVIVNDKFN